MNVASLRAIVVAAVVALVLAPAALFAQEPAALITSNLSRGDTGEEVTLLQTWMSTDAEIYPEQAVTGTFDAATEAAVKRYQEHQGIILDGPSGGGMYGIVGPITRANLNAAFSENKGGIAAVEAEYSDAAFWNGVEFLRRTGDEPQMTEPVISRIHVWVKPAALSKYAAPVFENGDGFVVGFEEHGRLYVEGPGGKASTRALVARAGAWQHIDVRFTTTHAVVLFDGKNVGTYVLSPQRPWTAFDAFFDRIVATFAGPFTLGIASEPAMPVKSPEAPEPRAGIFGSIASFFRGLFGEKPQEPAPEPPQVAVEEPAPVPVVTPEKPPAATTSTSSVFAPPPVVTLPPAPKIFAPATTTVATTTTTATTTVATSTTATSTTSTTTRTVASGGGSTTKSSIPVINLEGSKEVVIVAGNVYTDPGASASDKEDGDLTDQIVVGGDTVDPDEPDEYVITYNVTDSEGNKAKQVKRTVTVRPASIPESEQQPRYPLSAAGEDITYTVSNGEEADPIFVSVQISPLHVYVGQTQTFTVTASSPGGIESVVSETELDSSTLELPLVQTGGSGDSATFSASWEVYDTHVRTYETTFTATGVNGNENSITMAWSDPCAGVTQGTNDSLDSNCSISDVSGLDGGNLTISPGVTLTLNTGATWAWNPGTTITVNGAITKASGAQLRKGYLFYSGSTNDSANTSSMIFNAASSLTGHVRVNQYSQPSYYSYGEGFYCFSPDTRILMADGTEKPIKDVKLGDVVMGQNAYGVMKPNVVVEVYDHQYEENGMEYFPVLLVNGHLEVTREHPMFTTRGIVDAGDLRVGDRLITLEGEVDVASIEAHDEGLPRVLNLGVYPDHTYFANGIKVHNKFGGSIP